VWPSLSIGRPRFPVVLIQGRRAFQSGATQALSAMLRAWPNRERG
jgi:hypothetical protein